MEFEYLKQGKPIYTPTGLNGEMECDGHETESVYFEPTEKELENALVEVLTYKFYRSEIAMFPQRKESLSERVREHVKLCNTDNVLADAYYEDLKEFFKDKALNVDEWEVE